MTARGVRSVWIVAFAVLLLGGGLVACLGAGLFGTHRASEAILSAHVLVHWWREGHWLLLLVVALVAFVVALVGADLARRQLRPHAGRHQLDDLVLESGAVPGVTAVHASALRHALEADLARQPELAGARIGLYSTPSMIAMDGRVTANETVAADRLLSQSEDVLARWAATTGLALSEATIVLKHTGRHQPRQVT